MAQSAPILDEAERTMNDLKITNRVRIYFKVETE